MKYLISIVLFTYSTARAQLTLEIAKDSTTLKFHISSYSYHKQFIGHRGYGAPIILTADGGAATFGDGDEGAMLVKLNKSGKRQWKKSISPKGNEMESQSVVEDKNGNYYV